MNRKTRSAIFLSDDETIPFSDEIWLSEPKPHDTGLLDQWGRPILRPPARVPFGFQGRSNAA